MNHIYWLMKFNSTWTSPVKLAAGTNRLRKPQNTHLYSSAFHRRPPKFPEVQAKQPSFTGVFKSLIRTWLFPLWSSSYHKKHHEQSSISLSAGHALPICEARRSFICISYSKAFDSSLYLRYRKEKGQE